MTDIIVSVMDACTHIIA